jgi:hypothetical protein
MMSLAALFVTVWAALCAAIGLGLKGSPEGAASLRHGLLVSALLSFVLMCQAGVFVSLIALVQVIREDGMPVCGVRTFTVVDVLVAVVRDYSASHDAEAVIALVRRLEVFLGALLVGLLCAIFAVWTPPHRDTRRGLWQLGAVAAALLVWGSSITQSLWSGLRWNAWRGALELPYLVPQRPPDVPLGLEDGLRAVCAQDGDRWRCMGKEGVTTMEGLVSQAHTPVAMPQDTPLAEVFVGSEDGPTLILCAGSPRTSTRGLERWFQPGIADCSTWRLNHAAPEDQSNRHYVVIEASRDWTVQELVDEVVGLPLYDQVWARVRWAEAPR